LDLRTCTKLPRYLFVTSYGDLSTEIESCAETAFLADRPSEEYDYGIVQIDLPQPS